MLTLHWKADFMRPCALVLGGFDGLHLGHRMLLKAAQETGLCVLLTSLIGGKEGMLFTEEERSYIFERAGVDCALYFDFGEELKNTPADRFLGELLAHTAAEHIFCGSDFRFGKGALGTPEFLKTHAARPVSVFPLLEVGGEKVAVSGIKQRLLKAEMNEVNALLGTDYFIGGTVEHGREVGRTYGFPTLNLTVPAGKLLPPDGVYGGMCETPKGVFSTIVNIGARPTFGVEERKIEAYLDGFSGDLYGAYVRVYPTEFYRAVSKFSGVDALKEQLIKDIERLRSRYL